MDAGYPLVLSQLSNSPTENTNPKPQADLLLSNPASLLLDGMRFTAAIGVVITHACLSDFHTGARDRQILGYVAVPVFFVLSGFVIRFVSVSRETTLREYAIDRASRIYSVILPALVVSLVVGGICFLLNRELFLASWVQTFHNPVARVLLSLTFLAQSWGLGMIPFTNLPFWSLSYECFYYAIYGIAFFLSGMRRNLGLILAAILAGPQILFLFPTWWIGVFVFDSYQRLQGSRWRPALLGMPLIWLVPSLVMAVMGDMRLLLWPRLLLDRFAALPHPLGLMHQPIRFATLFALGCGIGFAPVLLWLLLAVDQLRIRRDHVWCRAVRRVAEGTFTIYLLHYPLLVLVYFLGLLHYRSPGWNTMVVGLICVLLVLFSRPVDALKRVMRSFLRAKI